MDINDVIEQLLTLLANYITTNVPNTTRAILNHGIVGLKKDLEQAGVSSVSIAPLWFHHT